MFMFFQLLKYGWATTYSFGCQPVDYSNSDMAIGVSFYYLDCKDPCSKQHSHGFSDYVVLVHLLPQ